MRERTFRDEDLPPYPADTAIKAVGFSSENKGSNPSFCEGWVTRGELSDGDEIVYTYRRFFRFIMSMHSFYSIKL